MKPRTGDGEKHTSPKSDPPTRPGRARSPALASEWAGVDTLIRDLGAVVSAATDVRASVETATADAAIREAAEAVNRTISAPGNGKLLATAREAIQAARDIIASLPSGATRSRALGSAVDLPERDDELIESRAKASRKEP